MKKIVLASAAVLALGSTPALADGGMVESGTWYVGVAGGANWLGGTNLDTVFGPTLDTSFDAGWALSADVGYRWSGGLRTEIEGSYRRNKASSIIQNPGGPFSAVDGDVSQFSVMGNVLYDMNLSPNFVLTVGGGLGASNASVDVSSFSPSIPVIVDSGDSWKFAWQLIGGLGYSMSPNTEFFVEYHYSRSDSHDVVTFPPPTGIPKSDSMDVENHSVMGGIRFAIGR